MKCEGSGPNCAVFQEEYEEEEMANALECLLLQRRLQWRHTDNEDRITQSAGEWGFECWQEQNKFQFSKAFLWILCPTQPSIQNVMGLLFRRNSGMAFEDDLSLRSSVNFNNTWKYTSTPHTHVHTWSAQGNIIFLVITYNPFGLEPSNVKYINEWLNKRFLDKF